jgi:hypothetical protein
MEYRIEQLVALKAELQAALEAGAAKQRFGELFPRWCVCLELSDLEAADKLDTSRPSVSRWENGKVVPPAARLVMKFMLECVDQRINTVQKQQSSQRSVGGATRRSSLPPLAARGR